MTEKKMYQKYIFFFSCRHITEKARTPPLLPPRIVLKTGDI
ncbi:hypothetical protein BACEGG_03509 [Bacteroides eggerthii DSM 20697]|nr:hypothetical protein BACEGG_03509 [Bacteroides eggerthii DSM 20697]